ncbi:MAG: hypothetical protein ACRD5M_02230 [Candidatus Acidiferrales bacterium]
MTEPLASADPGTQKRRSTRIVQAVPLTVTGVDALGQPFKERTTTVMVNCHGCKYQSKHYVPKNSIVTLDIPRQEAGLPPRSVQGRVVWVQRPRTVRELFQIGLEFEVSGNVWGIAFPPEDWGPYPDEAGPEFHVPIDAAGPETKASAPTPEAPVGEPEEKAEAPAAPATTVPASSASPSAPPPAPPKPAAPTSQVPDAKIHVMPSPAQDSQLAMAKTMAKMVAEAKENLDKTLRKGAETAITEEMTVVRQQLDAQLHEAVERAIKVSMERVSESTVKKVVQQAAERTASIVDEARKANESNAAQLDSKVRQAVQEAVSGAAEQAAQQAAQHSATHNLKQAVEEAVERAISGREASTPSLGILSSPEAAQKHLDDWKKTLEDTAHTVRNQTVAQTSVEAAAASHKWQEEFDAAVAGATQKVDELLSEASRAALAETEQEIGARSSKMRLSVGEVVNEAEAFIRSLGAGLQQERARAEETKSQLQDSVNSTIEQGRARAEETKAQLQEAANIALQHSRQRLDELLAAQYAEIGRKADQVIADRAEQIEPTLEAAAQKVADRLSGQLDQNLSPKLEQVQNAVSQLAIAEQQAAKLQDTLREQVRRAAEESAQIHSNVREKVQEASQQAIQESLDRLKQETAKIPAEVEQKSREAVSKLEEELEQKRVETEHTTYESLLKASEWYQKKAQTTMQSTLERAVEQSTTALRDRAAEISSLLASELDHYRRTYVDHSQAQIEETAKEVVDRERGKLNETADIASADFADRVHKVTGDSLRRFEQVSRDALEKAHADMEYNREGSLAKFQERLDERLQEGIEQARDQLQSQLLPLMQAWEANRETQQREWMDQLKNSSNESIEQYKARLENASNSWLLASATTLGQHSQTVLETIAKAAEKRLRETCSDVLAGMGDTLKERLLGISTDFGAEEDEDGPPKKKK